jgi:phosphatidylserine/phosphatidylglycerophosphate/cardiolipin synthase-like enzyme
MRNGWVPMKKRRMRECFRCLLSQLLLINGHRYISELLYIHTKLMIVDDKKVIVSACRVYSPVILFIALQMGSANINDRSQKVSCLHVCHVRYDVS